MAQREKTKIAYEVWHIPQRDIASPIWDVVYDTVIEHVNYAIYDYENW